VRNDGFLDRKFSPEELRGRWLQLTSPVSCCIFFSSSSRLTLAVGPGGLFAHAQNAATSNKVIVEDWNENSANAPMSQISDDDSLQEEPIKVATFSSEDDELILAYAAKCSETNRDVVAEPEIWTFAVKSHGFLYSKFLPSEIAKRFEHLQSELEKKEAAKEGSTLIETTVLSTVKKVSSQSKSPLKPKVKTATSTSSSTSPVVDRHVSIHRKIRSDVPDGASGDSGEAISRTASPRESSAQPKVKRTRLVPNLDFML